MTPSDILWSQKSNRIFPLAFRLLQKISSVVDKSFMNLSRCVLQNNLHTWTEHLWILRSKYNHQK